MLNKLQLWPTCWYVRMSENKFRWLMKHHYLYFYYVSKVLLLIFKSLMKLKSVYIDDYKLVMVIRDIKFCENNSFLQDLLVSKILWKVCRVKYIKVGPIFFKNINSIFSLLLKWIRLVWTFKLQVNIDLQNKISRVVLFNRDLYVQNLLRLRSLREYNLTTRLLTCIKMSFNWFENSLKFFCKNLSKTSEDIVVSFRFPCIFQSLLAINLELQVYVIVLHFAITLCQQLMVFEIYILLPIAKYRGFSAILSYLLGEFTGIQYL